MTCGYLRKYVEHGLRYGAVRLMIGIAHLMIGIARLRYGAYVSKSDRYGIVESVETPSDLKYLNAFG
jgi:hypothetical protein